MEGDDALNTINYTLVVKMHKTLTNYMKTFFIPLLAILLLNACNNQTPVDNSFRDSVMTEYLNSADSLGLEDTTAMMYKMLKAYANNDKRSLKRMLQRQQHAVRYFYKLLGQLPKLQ